MSLKKSALSGMMWTSIQQLSAQGIRFVVSIILARILLPEEFGLIALLGVFMAMGNLLINSGLSQSLIRVTDLDQDDYSSVFWFNMLISILIYLLMVILAPWVAEFYNKPLLTPIIRLYCMIFVIDAFVLVQNTLLSKEMNFKKQTLVTVPSIIVGSTVGIYMAYNGFGVWSLVWSAITKSTVLSIQLWIRTSWRPSLSLNWDKVKHHLNFGYKLTLAGIINSLFSEIYTIIIGKFFSPIQVGFYNRANTLRLLPVQNFSGVLNRVTYPLFSKIQNDDVRLKSVYKRVMLMAVFLISPTLFLMSALAEPLFRFLLTEKWLPAVPYFQILCFSGVLYPIHSYNLNILTVKGRTDVFLKLEIIKKTLVLIVVTISIQWGIYGLLIGSVALSINGLIINTYYSGKLIDYKLKEQLKDLFPSMFLALTVAITIFCLDFYFGKIELSDIIRLTIGFILGFLIFLGMASIFKMQSVYEIKAILRKKR